jgi:hypothetical protein
MLPCGFETKSAEEHLYLLMDRLPDLQHFDMDCGLESLPTIRIKTLEDLLQKWTFIAQFPPDFVRLSEPCPTTVVLPSPRTWTGAYIATTDFADWSLDQLLGFAQRSTEWRQFTWRRSFPGQVMDSKMLGLVIEQFKAPLQKFELGVPVVPSHDNLVALSRVRAAERTEGEPAMLTIVLGPSHWAPNFGNHLNNPETLPKTDLTTKTLAEFIVNGSPVGRRSIINLTYAPVRVSDPQSLYILGYNQNVSFGIWISNDDWQLYKQTYPKQTFWTAFASSVRHVFIRNVT